MGRLSAAFVSMEFIMLTTMTYAQQKPTPTPVQIQVAPASAAVGIGGHRQFSATDVFIGGLKKSGAARNVGACYRWRSSNQGVASIGLNTGLALGVSLGQTTISASCGPFRGSAPLTVLTAVCGDGARQTGEQCDDGNTLNLDGCNSVCKFEQDQRVNSLNMQFVTDTTCAKNALGGAIAGVAQGQLQTPITNGVDNGSITMLTAMLGITDLTGTNEASFKMGLLGGTPVAGSGYNGASDLDWWYTANPSDIDANRIPIDEVNASISSHNLSAGPASFKLPPLLGGTTGLQLSNTMIKATTGATSTPLVSSNNMPPGHLPTENLDPALMSYGSMSAGSLCGGLDAFSLAAAPVPAALQSGGAAACSAGYTANNSLLDMLVGGCVVGGFITVVNPTQPDTADPNAPVAGAGAPYLLIENGSHQVSACKDKNGTAVNLQSCLAAAAYSSYLTFTTDRVIIK
jgi:cysteine-rich repeat protein